MTQAEYATRRQALDRQLEAGMELLRQAHQVQVRALEMVWMANPGAELPQRPVAGPATGVVPAPEPAPQPGPRRNRGAGELYNEVVGALEKVGQEFVSSDICRALGFQPDRSSLLRAFRELASDGRIKQAKPGSGRTPARWVKVDAVDAAGAAGS